MRTPHLLCIALLALTIPRAHATVWRVNNLGYSANFTGTTALQDAFDAASGSDTLHVEASPVDYGDVVLTGKYLIIIGPGYKLGNTPGYNPGLQARNDMATVNSITLGQGTSGTVV